MVLSNGHVGAWLEVAVMIFQVCGVASLCLNRLVPSGRWSDRGRVGFVLAMIGLGLAGALCGRQDSEFALFAGGTMTLLLIGMTAGNGAHETTAATGPRSRPEATLAA